MYRSLRHRQIIARLHEWVDYPSLVPRAPWPMNEAPCGQPLSELGRDALPYLEQGLQTLVRLKDVHIAHRDIQAQWLRVHDGHLQLSMYHHASDINATVHTNTWGPSCPGPLDLHRYDMWCMALAFLNVAYPEVKADWKTWDASLDTLDCCLEYRPYLIILRYMLRMDPDSRIGLALACQMLDIKTGSDLYPLRKNYSRLAATYTKKFAVKPTVTMVMYDFAEWIDLCKDTVCCAYMNPTEWKVSPKKLIGNTSPAIHRVYRYICVPHVSNKLRPDVRLRRIQVVGFYRRYVAEALLTDRVPKFAHQYGILWPTVRKFCREMAKLAVQGKI